MKKLFLILTLFISVCTQAQRIGHLLPNEYVCILAGETNHSKQWITPAKTIPKGIFAFDDFIYFVDLETQTKQKLKVQFIKIEKTQISDNYIFFDYKDDINGKLTEAMDYVIEIKFFKNLNRIEFHLMKTLEIMEDKVHPVYVYIKQ